MKLALLSVIVAGCSANVEPQAIPAGSCNQVPDPTNDVGVNVVVGKRPDAIGGTIVEGEYETVERTAYVAAPVSDTFARTSDRYRVKLDAKTGGHIEVAERVMGDDAPVRETWSFTLSGAALGYTKACPANGDAIDFGYTATDTEIRFFKPPTGPTGFVFVLRKTGP